MFESENYLAFWILVSVRKALTYGYSTSIHSVTLYVNKYTVIEVIDKTSVVSDNNKGSVCNTCLKYNFITNFKHNIPSKTPTDVTNCV